MLMLSASKTTGVGALLANFSIPLMLAGLYSLFMLAQSIYVELVSDCIFGNRFCFCHQWLKLLLFGIISKVAYEQSEWVTPPASNAKLINEVVLFLT